MNVEQLAIVFILGANAGVALIYWLSPVCREEIKKYMKELYE